jgi:hypothetical protein
MRRRTIGQRQSEASRDKDGIGQRIDKAHSVNQATQEAFLVETPVVSPWWSLLKSPRDRLNAEGLLAKL